MTQTVLRQYASLAKQLPQRVCCQALVSLLRQMLYSEIGLTPKHGTLTGHTKVHLSLTPFTPKYAAALRWCCLQRRNRCQERCRGNHARCSLSQRDVADQRKSLEYLCCTDAADFTPSQSEVYFVLNPDIHAAPPTKRIPRTAIRLAVPSKGRMAEDTLQLLKVAMLGLHAAELDDKKSQECVLSCFQQAAKH